MISKLVSDVTVSPLSVSRQRPLSVTYRYRRLKTIDLRDFHHHVLQSRLYSPDEFIKLFNTEVTEVLYAYSPVQTVMQWCTTYDDHQLSPEARTAKRACRRAQRRFRRTGLAEDHVALNLARKNARLQIEKFQAAYITE